MARHYGTVKSKFWDGETGRRLRKNRDAQVVAFYLMTCGEGSLTGLFHLALPTVSYKTGISEEVVRASMFFLAELEFCAYSEDEEMVWIPNLAREQVGEEVITKDHRWKAITKELESHRKSWFYMEFYKVYKDRYFLPQARPMASSYKAPSMPLKRPSQGGDSPPFEANTRTRSLQEQEQERTGVVGETPETTDTGPKDPVAPTPERPVEPIVPAPTTDRPIEAPSWGVAAFEQAWVNTLKKTPGSAYLWPELVERIAKAAALLDPPRPPQAYAVALCEAFQPLIDHCTDNLGWAMPALKVDAFKAHFERLEDWVAGKKPSGSKSNGKNGHYVEPARPQPPSDATLPPPPDREAPPDNLRAELRRLGGAFDDGGA